VVKDLGERLLSVQAGVVAHFYMDAELQGTLAALDHPYVCVADSLAMSERALEMVERGAKLVCVLGVDFMTENVRATLDAAGHTQVPVYRVTDRTIGCSLAQAAEAPAYPAYVQRAASTPRSLHVIYVNTSLRVKGEAAKRVPTITCTSSNVLPLVLQATAQVPELQIWFGPDTYMGRNLASILRAYSELPQEAIARLHPDHDAASLRAVSERFRFFEQGACVVHHMFGHEVVERVRRQHPDAYFAAHLEVPGEMFALGFEAQRRGRGVVGSTSAILDLAVRKAQEAVLADTEATIEIVLGTESGMVTSLARAVRAVLERGGEAGKKVTVEIVFPVAAEAVAATGEQEFPIVPGVAAGEGCSVAGGCASCPYMKMSSLDGLLDLLERVSARQAARPTADFALPTFAPARLADLELARRGAETIGFMRALQRTGKLPDELVGALLAEPRTQFLELR
jgi:quinolinate synthase